MDIFKFLINEEWEGLRIDKYLSSNLDFLSRSYIQKMIQEQNVSVNGKIYDALIYTNIDIDYINKIFFNEKNIEIPQEYMDALNLDKVVCIVKYGAYSKVLHANQKFYDFINYQEWNFKLKHQAYLNAIKSGHLNFNHLVLKTGDGRKVEMDMEVKNVEDVYLLIEK